MSFVPSRPLDIVRLAYEDQGFPDWYPSEDDRSMADNQHFPDARAYREYLQGNPPGDDPVTQLLPLVAGDPDRWLRVGHQLVARAKDMGRDNAIASVRADLEAGRL